MCGGVRRLQNTSFTQMRSLASAIWLSYFHFDKLYQAPPDPQEKQGKTDVSHQHLKLGLAMGEKSEMFNQYSNPET